MNEAAIVAARNGKEEIGYEEVDYAIDRVTVGMSKTTGTSFPSRQRLVAYHEAGHAVMGLLTPDYDMVTKEIIYGEEEVTTGASNDLQQVRNIARRMVAQWGFAMESMGQAPVAWEQPDGNSLMQ